MSESIQNDSLTLDPIGATADEAAPWAFIGQAAEAYGRPLDMGRADLAGFDDTGAMLLAFPWMDDAELLEALWALAASLR